MAKELTTLTQIRRKEQYDSLIQMNDRELCELIRAHFESHPTLPGEKVLKDEVNQRLSNMDSHSGEEPLLQMQKDEKENLASRYANTRIRETPVKDADYFLNSKYFDPTALKRIPLNEQKRGGATVYTDRIRANLYQMEGGDVCVYAEISDGCYRMIGSLPDNFLANNPMDVGQCPAEIQITDFSNGKMKNLSVRAVVDTDLMSGDVIDLDDDMLEYLDQTDELSQ